MSQAATARAASGARPRLVAFLLLALLAWLLAIGAGSSLLLALVEAQLAYLLLAWLLTGVSLTSLVASRQLPLRASAGEPIEVRVTLRAGLLPLFDLEVSDSLAALELPELRALVSLPPGAERSLSLRGRCRQARGCFAAGPLRLQVSDPLGLITRRRQIALPAELIVFPAPLDRQLPPLRARALAPTTTSGSRGRVGDGVVLRGVREAEQAHPRRIGWRASARHQRLITVELEAEGGAALGVLIDASAAAAESDPVASERALRLAATAVIRACELRLPLQLLGHDADDLATPPWVGATARDALLERLARLELSGQLPLIDALAAARPHVAPGSQLLILPTRVSLLPDDRLATLRASYARQDIELTVWR